MADDRRDEGDRAHAGELVWRVRARGRDLGVLTTEQVRAAIRNKAARRGAEVCREGSSDWTPVDRTAEFAGLLREMEAGSRLLALCVSGAGLVALALGLVSYMFGSYEGPVAHPTGKLMSAALGAGLAIIGPLLAADMREHGRRALIAGGGFLGVFVSQYVPLFGGIGSFGEPWSDARMSGMPLHVLALASLGAGAGFAAWYMEQRGGGDSAAAGTPPVPGVADRLRELDRLRAEGLISADEYEEKKRRLIDDL